VTPKRRDTDRGTAASADSVFLLSTKPPSLQTAARGLKRVKVTQQPRRRIHPLPSQHSLCPVDSRPPSQSHKRPVRRVPLPSHLASRSPSPDRQKILGAAPVARTHRRRSLPSIASSGTQSCSVRVAGRRQAAAWSPGAQCLSAALQQQFRSRDVSTASCPLTARTHLRSAHVRLVSLWPSPWSWEEPLHSPSAAGLRATTPVPSS
jgi:hypothetical protein